MSGTNAGAAVPVLLHRGKDWCISDCRAAVDRFHALARQYGSDAWWLSQTCAVVTNNYAEPEKGFPYEEWREEALKQMPGIAPGDA